MSRLLQISLPSAQYPIHLEETAEGTIRELLEVLRRDGRKSVLLTDVNLVQHQSELLRRGLGEMPRLALPAGEKSKSLEKLGRTLDFLAEQRLDRGGVLWVVGGGVIGDLGGFAAASFLRGISYVQVPTTLLAMVDSSVGGKTGINLSAGKNLVGAFHHPLAVHIGRQCLDTLPPREFAAGMAEVIKYGLLGDAALFARLEQTSLTTGSAQLLEVIGRCCEMKAAVVQADERETTQEGGRALLNLGHTFGHAIEQVTHYETYLHGEAVAVGLAAAARLSEKLGLIAGAEVGRIEQVLAAHALPTRLRQPLALAALMAAMQSDKKVRAGQLRFIVLNRLGEAATRSDIAPATVQEVWKELGAH